MPGRQPPPDPEAAAARKQAARVVRALKTRYPDAPCALIHQSPFELTVATILSAQCTDARVNLVTPALFARFPDAESLASAEPAELEGLIHSAGFFRAKAKNLIGMARGVVERHGGTVPTDLEAMTALPGVGRKTAHVVLGTGFGIPSGVVVDTHVKRLSRRLGLSTHTDPEKVERDLAAIVPKTEWIMLSHRMIAHGRAVCIAQKPRCPTCALAKICPRVGVDDGGLATAD
jgi:endonuclease-3